MEYPESVTFTVTQDHVDRGVYADARRCPVALAFAENLRALGFEFERVSVFDSAVVLVTDEREPSWFREVARYAAQDAIGWQWAYDASEPNPPAMPEGYRRTPGLAPAVPVTFTFIKIEEAGK